MHVHKKIQAHPKSIGYGWAQSFSARSNYIVGRSTKEKGKEFLKLNDTLLVELISDGTE